MIYDAYKLPDLSAEQHEQLRLEMGRPSPEPHWLSELLARRERRTRVGVAVPTKKGGRRCGSPAAKMEICTEQTMQSHCSLELLTNLITAEHRRLEAQLAIGEVRGFRVRSGHESSAQRPRLRAPGVHQPKSAGYVVVHRCSIRILPHPTGTRRSKPSASSLSA